MILPRNEARNIYGKYLAIEGLREHGFAVIICYYKMSIG
jgi:hypothetical protein